VLGGKRREGQADRERRVANRFEQCGVFSGQTSGLAAVGIKELRHHLPGHADGQRHLVAGGGAQVA
jgi:hypothetical protein